LEEEAYEHVIHDRPEPTNVTDTTDKADENDRYERGCLPT